MGTTTVIGGAPNRPSASTSQPAMALAFSGGRLAQKGIKVRRYEPSRNRPSAQDWAGSQADVLAYFLYVADVVGLPVMLYNFPELAGKRIELETIAAFLELGTVRAKIRAAVEAKVSVVTLGLVPLSIIPGQHPFTTTSHFSITGVLAVLSGLQFWAIVLGCAAGAVGLTPSTSIGQPASCPFTPKLIGVPVPGRITPASASRRSRSPCANSRARTRSKSPRKSRLG